jgi:hypothetical protein
MRTDTATGKVNDDTPTVIVAALPDLDEVVDIDNQPAE